jgi:hypothetical protein
MKIFTIILTALTLTACANPNLVGMRGDQLNTNYSLQDRRAAKSHIQVTLDLPSGAQTVGAGPFTVQRCHQYAQDNAPGEAVLLDDLVLLAYAEGADGVTDVKYDRESGLLKNCWYIAKASATFYKNKK